MSLILILSFVNTVFSANAVWTYSDPHCQDVVGVSGGDDNCTPLGQDPYQSFEIIELGSGCIVNLYPSSYGTCSGSNIIGKVGTCYNTEYAYYIINCPENDPSSVAAPTTTAAATTTTTTAAAAATATSKQPNGMLTSSSTPPTPCQSSVASTDQSSGNCSSNSTTDTESQWAADISCYAIPYGLVGFLSHLWTYFTIFCLLRGRRPFMPWKRLSGHYIDPFLAIGQLAGSVGLAGFNIKRCSYSWQLTAITIWKMSLSIGLCAITLRAWLIVKGRNPSFNQWHLQEDLAIGLWTGMIYGLACIAGGAGLISIENHIGYYPGVSVRHDSTAGIQCEAVTIAFTLAAAFILISLVIYLSRGNDNKRTAALIFTIAAFSAFDGLFALYSDWILGIASQDLIGNPLDNRVLYWTYFAVKRLPFITT